jgi:hypothetical protein
MMRSLVAALFATMPLLASQAAWAQSKALPEPVAACISENAPKVERAVTSLPEATSFLVGSVCAAPIAEEQRRESRLMMQNQAKKMQALCDARKARGAKSGTSEDDYNPCDMVSTFSADAEQATDWTIFGTLRATPEPTAYGAKLLLDLRLARIGSKSP